MMAKAPTTPELAMIDRVAREIGLNLAATVDRFYPGKLTERELFNVKCWARGEVLRWFTPERGEEPLDNRLRASGAHRRHIKKLHMLAGTVEVGDPIEPVIAAFATFQKEALLDYRAGGPVIDVTAPDPPELTDYEWDETKQRALREDKAR